MRDVQVGQQVVFVDPHGVARPALVTAVWPGEYGSGKQPGVNVVYASDDTNRNDCYGRQIERSTSVCHRDVQPAHGNYWHGFDE